MQCIVQTICVHYLLPIRSSVLVCLMCVAYYIGAQCLIVQHKTIAQLMLPFQIQQLHNKLYQQPLITGLLDAENQRTG